MELKKDALWRTAKDYIFITIAMALYGFGFTAFILPQKVVIGGIAGLGSLIYFTTGIPVAVASFTLNLILLAIAYRIVGRKFVIGTLYGVLTSSIFIGIFQPIFADGLIQDTLMNLIIGGACCGVAIGICFIHNGSTGGTDIVAAVVTKHSNVSVGRVMLIVDLCIISSSYLIFHQIDTIVYGIVVLILYSYLADMVINTTRQAVQFTIYSSKWQEIAEAVTKEAHRGCTILDGMGWFSRRPVKIIIVMCRKIESVTIFRIVKSIDKEALIAQTSVNGVYGRGFDEMKMKIKANKHNKPAADSDKTVSPASDGLPVFNERQTPPLDAPTDTTNASGHPYNMM